MTCLERYKNRITARGGLPRESWLKNTQTWINTKLPASLSYFTVVIDGEERQCAIISSRHPTSKQIIAMPGETLTAGTYVEWEDCKWLITEVDPQNEVYQSASMTQCNYLLKWINNNGELISRWVIALDGTKYLTGEYDQQVVTMGDARLQVTMPRDSETVLVNRGARFLIDDPEANQIMAFKLTKVNRSGSVYGGNGVYVHMMTEDVRQDGIDNYELMVANYYDRIGKFSVQFSNANDTLSMSLGDTFLLQADVYKDAKVFDGGRVIFSSSNSDVAMISDNGVLFAVSDGECEITASYLTFSNTIRVSVNEVLPGGPEPENYYISFGDMDQTQYALVGSTMKIPAELYLDGELVPDAEFTYDIDCASTIATMSAADGVATIVVDKNRKNIGTKFTVTATCEAVDVSHSKEFTVKGWS